MQSSTARRPHEKLDRWRLGRKIVTKTYRITEKLPDTGYFSLSTQLRKAPVSIPSQIAEGTSRKTTKNYINVLYIAIGSLHELRTQVILTYELELAPKERLKPLMRSIDELGPKLTAQLQS